MDIKCRKTECEFNNKFVCSAKVLNIDKCHFCKTYCKTKEEKQNTSKLIFLKKVEYAPFRHCTNLEINCKEQCLFNQNGLCKANGILVNVEKERPKCLTFLKK